MTEEADIQPLPDGPEDNPDFPGSGRSKDEIPGDAPVEEVFDKFQTIIDRSNAEGRLAVRVLNQSGDETERLETRRISGEGSVEVRAFEENGEQKWTAKRKDKLPHNKNDKL